jgi:hypothetical protein
VTDELTRTQSDLQLCRKALATFADEIAAEAVRKAAL